MNLFQIIALSTLGLVLLWELYGVARYSVAATGRWLRITIWLLAALAIWRPDLTQSAAEFFGIGLGSNLLLYALTLAFIGTSFFLYSQIVRQRRDTTELVRQLAIRDARPPLRAERGEAASAPQG